ncbi:hypothetical protein N9H39_01850 [Gammaproteobacteria bacterium]|nr:hypothetical protein [Gammaproteobacteria bacterium]
MNRRGTRHRSIEETQSHFEQWFQDSFIGREKRHSTPHVMESYPFVDFTISQENLEQDLTSTLKKMNLGEHRIPGRKKWTTNKLPDYTQYYSKSLIPLVLDVYRYEMNMLNYEIPEVWRHFQNVSKA